MFDERCEELLPARPRAASAARRKLAQDLAALLAQAHVAMRRVKGLLPQPALESLKAQRHRLEALLQLHGGGEAAMGPAELDAARVPSAAENRAAREIRCANCQQLAMGAKLCGGCKRVHYCRWAGGPGNPDD